MGSLWDPGMDPRRSWQSGLQDLFKACPGPVGSFHEALVARGGSSGVSDAIPGVGDVIQRGFSWFLFNHLSMCVCARAYTMIVICQILFHIPCPIPPQCYCTLLAFFPTKRKIAPLSWALDSNSCLSFVCVKNFCKFYCVSC